MVSIKNIQSTKGSRPAAAPPPPPGQARPTRAAPRRPDAQQAIQQQIMQQIDRDPGRSAYDMSAPAREARDYETDVMQESAGLREDFAALQEGTPEEVRDWKQIADMTVGLSAVDDPETQEIKNALIWSYGDQLKPHIDVIDPNWWEANYSEPEEPDLPWYQDVLKAVSPGLEYLDQWGQSALGAVGGVRAAIDPNDGVSVGAGLTHAVEQGLSAMDPTRLVPGADGVIADIGGLLGRDMESGTIQGFGGEGTSLDQDESGFLNAREAIGLDPGAGGRWGGVLDLIASIAIDPTTWVTLGAGAKAKIGFKGAEEAAERIARTGARTFRGRAVNGAMAREMRERIMRDGWKALDEGEQRFFEGLVRDTVEQGTRQTTRLGRDLAEAQLDSIRRGGQSGLRIGGRTVAPTRGRLDRLGRGRETFGVRDARNPAWVDNIGNQVDQFEMPDPNMASRYSGPQGFGGIAEQVGQLPANMSAYTPPRFSKFLDRLPADDGGLIDDIGRQIDEGVEMTAGTSPVNRLSSWTDDIAKQVDELGLMIDDIPLSRLDEAPAARQLQEVYSTGIRRGLLGELADSKYVRKLRTLTDRLSPRAAFNIRFGKRSGDELQALISNTDAAAQTKSKDLLIQYGLDTHKGGLMRDSIAEYANEESWIKALNDALSSKAGREAALGSTDLPPRTRQLIETMQETRKAIRQAALDGGANPEHLRALDEYLPRVLTDAARRDATLMRQLQNVDDPMLAMGGDRVAENFMQRRTVAEEIDNLWNVNEEVFEALRREGIEAPEQLFEANPVAAYALRGPSAFRAAADVDLLNGLTKMDAEGLPLAFRATPADAGKLTPKEAAEGMVRRAGAKSADYRTVRLDNGNIYRVHNDVARELEDARRIFTDPKATDEFGKWYDDMNNMWARSATVFGVNPAFHIRNRIGNWFNSFLGGTRDPLVFAEAYNLQWRSRKIVPAMRETGQTWDEAAEALVEAGELTAKEVDILRGARMQGIMSDGRAVDVLRNNPGQETFRLGDTSLSSRLNPTNSSNFVGDRWGRAIGQNVEGGDRLAVYIDQLNKGASPEAAARHVKSTLFDYGDLTRFEAEKVRRISRFYTFMRKNTALQAYTLFHYPARVRNAEKGVEGFVNAVWGGESEEDRMLPPWMAGASVMNAFGGGQAAIDVDTPWASFGETMQILTGPPSDNPLDKWNGEHWLRGIVARTENLFSGVGLGMLDWMDEVESGRDSFTGRALDPENQVRDTAWFGLLSTMLPGVGRAETWASRFEPVNDALSLRRDEDGNVDGAMDWRMALINNFSGLQMYQLSDDTDYAGRYTVLRDLQQIFDDMRDDGIDVPTVPEMREAGEIGMRNRVVETLMYGWTEDEDGNITWDDEAANSRLLQILPKNVRDAFVQMGVLTEGDITAMDASGNAAPRGNRPEAEEGSAEEMAQLDFDFGQALSAIEQYLGRDLSDDEKWTMVSAFGGALGITDQENAGFNPYRENRLLDPEASEAEEMADYERKTEIFNRRLASVGMTWEQALERNPRISRMQRRIEDARAAGWSEEEIRTALYYAPDEGGEGWLSRADRAAINQFMTGDRLGGAVPLTTTRFPIVSDEDLQKLQTKVWEGAEELRLVYAFEGWGTPSQEELFMYGVNNLTKTEQRKLGIDPLRGAPNREDVRTDDQYMADARSRLGAVEAGLSEGAFRWEPTGQPDFAPWER